MQLVPSVKNSPKREYTNSQCQELTHVHDYLSTARAQSNLEQDQPDFISNLLFEKALGMDNSD